MRDLEKLNAYSLAKAVLRFVAESNAIEGIHRKPTDEEAAATLLFLSVEPLTLDALLDVQRVYAPGMPLRTERGMNVRVGNHLPPLGGPAVGYSLEDLIRRVNEPGSDPWACHVEFETLHPFLDGNGRSGRAVWAWHMLKSGQDPFALGFLHRFYYQTLASSDGRRG